MESQAASGGIRRGRLVGSFSVSAGQGKIRRDSLRDLAAVRRVGVPGAIVQTLIPGRVVAVLGHAWGDSGGAVVMGLALGVASTVMLPKGLEQRDALDSTE